MLSQSSSVATNKGRAAAALILTVFGAFWALISFSDLDTVLREWLSFVLVLVTILLAYFSISLWIRVRQPSAYSSCAREERGRTRRRRFSVVSGTEVAMIIVAAVLLGRAQHGKLIPLVISLIVGIHFIPLAIIFRNPTYFLTGIAMSLLGAISLLFMYWDSAFAPWLADVIVGLGNAIILWLTALYVLYIGGGLPTSPT